MEDNRSNLSCVFKLDSFFFIYLKSSTRPWSAYQCDVQENQNTYNAIAKWFTHSNTHYYASTSVDAIYVLNRAIDTISLAWVENHTSDCLNVSRRMRELSKPNDFEKCLACIKQTIWNITLRIECFALNNKFRAQIIVCALVWPGLVLCCLAWPGLSLTLWKLLCRYRAKNNSLSPSKCNSNI